MVRIGASAATSCTRGTRTTSQPGSGLTTLVESSACGFRFEEAVVAHGDQRDCRLCGTEDVTSPDPLAGRPAHGTGTAQAALWRASSCDAPGDRGSHPTTRTANA